MSDNRFLKTNELKSVLSRIKTRVESGIADAISGSTFSLNSLITDGDTLTLNSAKSYIDGIKTTLDTTIASNLATAKGYTDGPVNTSTRMPHVKGLIEWRHRPIH